MLAPDNYTLLKCLQADSHVEIHTALRDSDGRKVLLKSYRSDATAEGGSRARLELEALAQLASPSIVRALELIEGGDRPVLVLEQLEGMPLRQWVKARLPLDIEFLDIAVALSHALEQVHAANLLHRDIRPDHVIVDPIGLRTQLIGFGLARPLGTAASRGSIQEQCGGAERLPFMAPEQTGRMGRGMDARSDLYSLGATFYLMLTGVPPFEGDALALVHAHLARMPVSPLEIRPSLPPTLARIVLKLLQKEPEDRYQTARALHHDLSVCRDQLVQMGRIEDDLPLGTADLPMRPLFRKKVYGRERELKALHDAYARATRGGAELLTLRGVAGSGKSTLVHELRRTLPSSGGYLAAGKFDLYRRDVPYAGLAAGFTALLDQIFTETQERVERWRCDLEAALGGLAGVLLELIPDLRRLLGDLPPPPPLGSRETQARLDLAVRRLVNGCAAGDHPLVLFLDDVQWADPGSLELIESLVLHGEARNLLVIMAYRDEEISSAHPLHAVLARVESRSTSAAWVELEALSVEAASEMLSDALGRGAADTRELATIVVRKTGGVPFLLQQFILHMHALGLFRFVDGTGWDWDLAAVEATEIPAGAVALMVTKLERLREDARAVLQFASCVSYEFDVHLLAELSGRDRASLESALFSIAEDGLIAPSPRGFRFVHDRVREGAQAMLSEDERARVHFGVAQHLLARLSPDEQAERIFELAEHVNGAIPYVPEELRLTAVRLNLDAGRRALKSGAAATAATYFGAARRSFRESDLQEHGSLGFDLFLYSADSALRMGQAAQALELLDRLERSPLSRLETARAIGLRVQVYALTKAPLECVEYSLSALRRFGVRWSPRPSNWRVALAVRGVQRRLHGRSDENFLEPATALDLDKLATFLIIDQTGASLSQSDMRFATLAACYVLSDYLKNGYIARPGFTLAAYATFSLLIHGDPEQSARISRLAFAWSEREPDPLWDLRTAFQLHCLLGAWLMPRREAIPLTQRVLEGMWEVGDTEFIYHLDAMLTVFGILAGGSVSEMDERLRRLSQVSDRDPRYTDFALIRRAYRPLTEVHPGHVTLDGDPFDCDVPRGVGWEANEPIARTLWMLVLCVYGHWEQVVAESNASLEPMLRLGPWAQLADHALYCGLAAAALAESTRGLARWRHRRTLRAMLGRLHDWCRFGPDFAHMLEILEAEQARLEGHAARARQLYQSAAEHATAQGFTHHRALAQEREASMLTRLRREIEAAHVLKQAIASYTEWGARAKAAALEEQLR